MNDRALDLAYEAHRRYLDADSADCGPIEDYIAEAIRRAIAELQSVQQKTIARLEIQLDERMSATFDEHIVSQINNGLAQQAGELRAERDRLKRENVRLALRLENKSALRKALAMFRRRCAALAASEQKEGNDRTA